MNTHLEAFSKMATPEGLVKIVPSPPPKKAVLFALRLPAPPQKPYELNSTRIYLHYLDLTLPLRCCPESPLHFFTWSAPFPPPPQEKSALQ